MLGNVEREGRWRSLEYMALRFIGLFGLFLIVACGGCSNSPLQAGCTLGGVTSGGNICDQQYQKVGAYSTIPFDGIFMR